MKGTDRTILIVLPLIALAIGFYLLVLSPKQKEAGELQEQVDSLQSEVTLAEEQITIAEAARASFGESYSDLVELGVAVPEDDDQATLIHDLSAVGAKNKLNFQSFQVDGEAEVEAAPAESTTSTATGTPPAEGSTTATDSATASSTTATAAPAATAVPATEATAATLPIGATVGPAGLPVTPYKLEYFGQFFDVANLFADLDSKVEVTDAGTNPVSHGRLMTVDGFALAADPVKGFPSVAAEIAVTTYMVPADQGISAGASPAGPAPLASSAAPVSADPAAASPTPTAAVSP